MEFSIPLAQLTKQIQQLSSICPNDSNKTGDIIQNILFVVEKDRLIMRATDYSIECSCELPVSDVVSTGAAAINAVKLVSSCHHLNVNSPIKFKLDEENQSLTITSDNCSYKVRARSKAEFPDFPFDDVEQKVSVKQKVLKEIIDKSIFCIASDDFREYLRGLRIEINGADLTVFASDSHRMAIVETKLDTPVKEPVGVTINKKFAHELSKILNNSDDLVELNFSRGKVGVKCNNYTVISNLIVCTYPNVRSIIPKQIKETIDFPTQDLKSMVSRVSVLSSKRVNGVTFNFDSNKLNLHAENTDHETASDLLSINYAGKPFDITLNAVYVNDILGAINTENVSLNFPNDYSSALLAPASSDDSEVKPRYLISRIIV